MPILDLNLSSTADYALGIFPWSVIYKSKFINYLSIASIGGWGIVMGWEAFTKFAEIDIERLVLCIVLAYATVILIFNKTKIILTSLNKLKVIKGPIYVPFFSGTHEINLQDIERIDIFRIEIKSSYSYPIRVVTKTKKDFEILSLKDANLSHQIYSLLLDKCKIQIPITEISRKRLDDFENSDSVRISKFYHLFLNCLLVLNIPAVYFTTKWTFDKGYWSFFGMINFGIFCMSYFHHRKYLNLSKGQPLKEGDQKSGIVAYLIMSIIETFMITPILMAVYTNL